MAAVMNTFALYEQFRTVLGEERAKDFAETIGKMIEDAKNSATKEDIRLLRESVDANTSRLEAALARLAEAQARTEERLDRLEQTVEKLVEAQARTEAQVEALAEAQARTEAKVEALAEAQARTEAKVEALAEAQARTEGKLEQLIEIVTKLVIRSDRHEGDLLELRFRNRLPSYLGRLLRKAKVIEAADLIDAIEPVLGAVAVDDFLRADVVATGILHAGSRDPLPAGSRGTLDGSLTYLVGEISFTADENDVMRAARRTACLVKAGLPAIALVACERIAPQTAEYARKEGVRVWLDGRVLDADSPPESPAA
jgi:multidrug efflux pump subunit AcrA (membrane-fusion protein)